MTHAYRHTQFGTVIACAVGAVLAWYGVQLWAGGAMSTLRVPLILLAVVLLLFVTLTTEVEQGRLRCYFALGLIRRTIATRDITAVAVVRNSWLSGWGIRMIGNGWLWN